MTVLLAAWLGLAAPARAAFGDADLTPRTGGMGGAFAAVAEGPDALPFNPAGLASGRRPHVAASYGRLRELPGGRSDRTDFGVSVAGPLELGGRGGWGLLWRREGVEGGSRDQRFQVGWARRAAWAWDRARLDLGAAASFLRREDGSATAQAAAVDAGAILAWGSGYRFGAAVLNANEPRLDLPGSPDAAPRAVKLGLARQLPFWTLALDWTQRSASALGPSGSSVHAGIEHWLPWPRYGTSALRTGLTLGEAGELYTAGFSVQRGGAELLYAFQLPLKGPKDPGHQLALGFRFGGPDPEDLYRDLLREERRSRKEVVGQMERQEELMAALRQDLLTARIEAERFRLELERQVSELTPSKEKLQLLMELQAELQRDLERGRRGKEASEAKAGAPSGFAADWQSYLKLKASGPPAHVLSETLQGLIEKYRGTPADLSEAYGEFLAIERGYER